MFYDIIITSYHSTNFFRLFLRFSLPHDCFVNDVYKKRINFMLKNQDKLLRKYFVLRIKLNY